MSGEHMWFYMDSTGQEFGPYESSTMKGWFQQGFFPMQGELQVRLQEMSPDEHYYIRDLYPSPIMERAFDGPPNVPSSSYTGGSMGGGGGGDGGGGGGGGRHQRGGHGGGGGGGRNAAAHPPPMPMNPMASPYDHEGLGAAALWGGMPGMMPGAGMHAGMPGMAGMMAGYGLGGMRPGLMPGAMPMAGGLDAGMMMQQSNVAAGRFQGRIKSFNTQKGFGFVECPEAHQIYGRDVFLHKAQVATFQIGSMLTFSVEMNKNNMPQARDLVESDTGLGGGMGFPGMGMGFPGMGGKGGHNNPKAGGGGAKGGKGGAKGGAKPKAGAAGGAKKNPNAGGEKKAGGNGAAPKSMPGPGLDAGA